MAKEFFALVSFGAGGSYFRGKTFEKTMEGIKEEAAGFAKALGGFKPDAEYLVNLFEIIPGEEIEWNEMGVFGSETGQFRKFTKYTVKAKTGKHEVFQEI